MATLREVKKRIRSVQSTQRITRAMEMVAAAKLRRAQQRAEQAAPYARKMDEMLSHLAAAARSEIVHPYFEEREVKRKTLVVVASDRGLCGSYNSSILRRSDEWLRQNTDVEVEIVAVGKRSRDYHRNRNRNVIKYVGDWAGGAVEPDKAQDLVRFLTDRFVSGETDRIDLLYSHFASVVRFVPTMTGYLPVARPEIQDEDEAPVGEYIFEPSPEEIYAALMPGYAMTKMVTALLDSFASEYGSRMMAMGNATKNAGEMVERLTLEYNKARQAKITTEITEVVSGAEALKG